MDFRFLARITGSGLFAFSAIASALEFDLGGVGLTVTNRLSLGAAWRVEERDPALIGKLNLNPGLCAGDDCISLSGDPEPNQRLVDAPGGFFADKQDDGNMSYDRGDVVAAVGKLTSDFSLSWNDYDVKARVITFFDAVNNGFDDTHFNNSDVVSPGVGGYQPAKTRREGRVDDLIGAAVRLQDLALTGTYYFGDRLLTVGLGQQKVRWGEANLMALGTLNEVNPPDIRALRQPGGQLSELFQPVPMVLVSGDFFPDFGISAEAFYQLHWKPVIADPGGSFFGEFDALYRDDNRRFVAMNLAQFPEDPPVDDGNGRLRGQHRLQIPAAQLLTDTSFTAQIDDDNGEPDDAGQYGVRINWFVENLNNGTELGFYAMNYHSRLPYLSFFAADRSPLRDETTGFGEQALTSCQLVNVDCLPVDSTRALLEYPENIQMFGLSFSTNIGSWSVTGEYAYRPNVPVQVHMTDVLFAALQPAFPENDIVVGSGAVGMGELDALLGTASAGELPITVPSARTAAPDFVETLYRRNGDVDANIEERGENYYIQGYVRQKVGQLVVNGLKIFGSSHPVSAALGAEQVIMLVEAGMTHILDMPSTDLVQFDGGSPNRTHASPGADGTGVAEGESVNRISLNPTQQTEALVDEFSWGYRVFLQGEYNDVFWGMNLKPFLIAAHDVEGFAPSPQQNFLEGRVEVFAGMEWFLGQRWSGRVHYNLHSGTRHNAKRDRDNLLLELSYTF